MMFLAVTGAAIEYPIQPVHGFGRVDKSSGEDLQPAKKNMASLNCSVHLTDDKLRAYLFLADESVIDRVPLSVPDIMALLGSKGVIYGIDAVAIEHAVAYFSLEAHCPASLLVAAGTPPVSNYEQALGLQFIQTMVTCDLSTYEAPEIQVCHRGTLVRPGTLLARSRLGSEDRAGRDLFGQTIAAVFSAPLAIRAGNNVTVEDESSFFASCSGYPGIECSSVESRKLVMIRVDKMVQVSADKLQARLLLRPPFSRGPDLTRQLLVEILQEEGVVFGLLHQQIEACIDGVNRAAAPLAKTVAMGIVPQNGEDARLRFAIEVGPLPGKVMGDGSIDFRERKMFVGVNAGELIATKVPATPGCAGRDVFAVTIEPERGRDINVKPTDDAVFDEETGELRAACSGVLSKVSENSVKVCAKQVISGDIDYATGNIISRDALEIGGSIRPKFKVVALGDVLIGGSVEKAGLRSEGNVVIKGGVIGKFAQVRSRGDVDLNFVEHGRVYARGSVILRKSAYYGRLHAWDKVQCPPTSTIIGCQIVAGTSVTAGNVGRKKSAPTLLAAAVDPERLQIFFDLRRDMLMKQELVEQARQLYGSGAMHQDLHVLHKEMEDACDALSSLNLIPGTALGRRSEGLFTCLREQIFIHGTVYPGTEIRIGNSTLVNDRKQTGVRFHLVQGKEGAAARLFIACSPLRGKSR
jgi:uncharacterized protein (DUF342 family)